MMQTIGLLMLVACVTALYWCAVTPEFVIMASQDIAETTGMHGAYAGFLIFATLFVGASIGTVLFFNSFRIR